MKIFLAIELTWFQGNWYFNLQKNTKGLIHCGTKISEVQEGNNTQSPQHTASKPKDKIRSKTGHLTNKTWKYQSAKNVTGIKLSIICMASYFQDED